MVQRGQFNHPENRFIAMYELQVDDEVIPLSSDPKEKGKTFTVTDLHPVQIGFNGDYQTVAATLWDGWREHVTRISMFQLTKRRWG